MLLGDSLCQHLLLNKSDLLGSPRGSMGRVVNGGMPPTHWHDSDVTSFQIRLRELASEFQTTTSAFSSVNGGFCPSAGGANAAGAPLLRCRWRSRCRFRQRSTTPSASPSGFGTGSSTNTSRPAPWRWPDSNAATRSSSATSPPRAVLMKTDHQNARMRD